MDSKKCKNDIFNNEAHNENEMSVRIEDWVEKTQVDIRRVTC